MIDIGFHILLTQLPILLVVHTCLAYGEFIVKAGLLVLQLDEFGNIILVS